VADWKSRAAEYHRESARMLGWTVRRGGRFPAVDSLSLPGPVSDYQAAHGIPPDGRIGPATLRSMIEVSKVPGPKFATEVVVEELDLSRADPDAGEPVRPGAKRPEPPPPPPPPGLAPPPAPPPAAAGGSGLKWLLWFAPPLVAAGIWYARKRKAAAR
jgi:hypothetical protein